ncbi:uncharacterized protein LOC132284438 isoform X2 [Cornus florida]|uniref:uncharacterized protein LOC132284438 isoform X2 n=1 Tax=Cornus florida TaxID=4283 RepID=UPI0028A225B4|nr:uncharacterized protein LOC132284438 isoform X2 [Cornus florida]
MTYDPLSTIIARMNLPFPLQCFEYPNMPENKFLNVHDLIIHLLEDVRSTANTRFSQSESAAGRKLLLCLTVDIERRVILPRHEIEAIDRLRKKEERMLQLHQFVSAMVRTDSEDPYLDFSSVERRIGREVRDTAPTEKAFLDRKYEKELELSLLEQAMGDYFQEPLETLTFQDWLKRSLMCPSCPFKLTTS